MDIESKVTSEMWDYYQDLIKTHGFNGITDLLKESTRTKVRMGEMAAEIERLQSIVDAANAQEPFTVIDYDGEKAEIVMHFEVRDIGKIKLYRRPIPAQQSPRITEQDAREILEGFCKVWHYSSEIGAFLGDSDCRDILAKLNEANNEKAN